jgi:hypothetical protein
MGSPQAAGAFLSMVDYETVRRRLGGDDEPPRFMIRRGEQILALCMRADSNPGVDRYPVEVWIEEGSLLEVWGDRLAMDTGALRLYVASAQGAGFRDRGVYQVIGSSDNPLDLAQRTARWGGEKLSRVVFLSGPHAA